MFRHLAIAAVAALGLGGCVSDYAYRGGAGAGDYYYGRPSVEYYESGYGAPYGSLYGYPGGYGGGYGGGIGYGYGGGYSSYGYGGYGYPLGYGGYGGYGGYYPYYPPYYGHGGHGGHGNHDGHGNHGDDDGDRPTRVTGGRLPPSMSTGGRPSRSQIMSSGDGRPRAGGQSMLPPGNGMAPGRGGSTYGRPVMSGPSRPSMSRPAGPVMSPQPGRGGQPVMSRPAPRMTAPVSRPQQQVAPPAMRSQSAPTRVSSPRPSNNPRTQEVER